MLWLSCNLEIASFYWYKLNLIDRSGLTYSLGAVSVIGAYKSRNRLRSTVPFYWEAIFLVSAFRCLQTQLLTLRTNEQKQKCLSTEARSSLSRILLPSNSNSNAVHTRTAAKKLFHGGVRFPIRSACSSSFRLQLIRWAQVKLFLCLPFNCLVAIVLRWLVLPYRWRGTCCPCPEHSDGGSPS